MTMRPICEPTSWIAPRLFPDGAIVFISFDSYTAAFKACEDFEAAVTAMWQEEKAQLAALDASEGLYHND